MLNAHSVFPAARPRLEVHARCSTPNAFIINQFEAGRRRTFVVRCRPRDPRCDNGGQVGTEGRWTHVAWIWCNPHVTGLSSTQSHSLQGSLLGGFKDLRSAVNNLFFWSRNPGLVRVKHGWEERKKRWRPGGSDRPVWTSICESEARALEAMTTRPCQLEGPHGFIGQKHTFIPWLAGARLQKTESKLARTCSMWYKVSYIYIYI